MDGVHHRGEKGGNEHIDFVLSSNTLSTLVDFISVEENNFNQNEKKLSTYDTAIETSTCRINITSSKQCLMKEVSIKIDLYLLCCVRVLY